MVSSVYKSSLWTHDKRHHYHRISNQNTSKQSNYHHHEREEKAVRVLVRIRPIGSSSRHTTTPATHYIHSIQSDVNRSSSSSSSSFSSSKLLSKNNNMASSPTSSSNESSPSTSSNNSMKVANKDFQEQKHHLSLSKETSRQKNNVVMVTIPSSTSFSTPRSGSLSIQDIERYHCHEVFGPSSSQEELFECDAIQGLLQKTLKGHQTTIFAYGQTGAGKTYTMLGDLAAQSKKIRNLHSSCQERDFSLFNNCLPRPSSDTAKSPFEDDNQNPRGGLLTRTVHKLFNRMMEDTKKQRKKYKVRFCCFEIYNDHVTDLLAIEKKFKESSSSLHVNNINGNRNRSKVYNMPTTFSASTTQSSSAFCSTNKSFIPHLSVREHQEVGFFVEGLTIYNVTSADQLLSYVKKALKNRHVAEHQLNMTSSRSHTLCKIYVDSADFDQNNWNNDMNFPSLSIGNEKSRNRRKEIWTSGSITLVDLAGSERVKETGNSHGTHLVEATSINSSLLSLSKCIKALLYKKTIPFRESTLTKLLQKSLSQGGTSVMIACVSPTYKTISESLRTLNFATEVGALRLPTSMSKVQIDQTANNMMDKQYANEMKAASSNMITKLKSEVERLRQENNWLRSSLASAPIARLPSNQSPSTALSSSPLITQKHTDSPMNISSFSPSHEVNSPRSSSISISTSISSLPSTTETYPGNSSFQRTKQTDQCPDDTLFKSVGMVQATKNTEHFAQVDFDQLHHKRGRENVNNKTDKKNTSYQKKESPVKKGLLSASNLPHEVRIADMTTAPLASLSPSFSSSSKSLSCSSAPSSSNTSTKSGNSETYQTLEIDLLSKLNDALVLQPDKTSISDEEYQDETQPGNCLRSKGNNNVLKGETFRQEPEVSNKEDEYEDEDWEDEDEQNYDNLNKNQTALEEFLINYKDSNNLLGSKKNSDKIYPNNQEVASAKFNTTSCTTYLNEQSQKSLKSDYQNE